MVPVASKVGGNDDATLIKLLAIPPGTRSNSENALLYTCLRKIEGLHGPGLTLSHREEELRKICRLARHRRVPGDTLLYSAGDACDAWFILLTGSVLIEASMFLPRACFGFRLNGSPVRHNDCLVLEMSDLVVIDYPFVARGQPGVGYTDTHNRAVTQHRIQVNNTHTSQLEVPDRVASVAGVFGSSATSQHHQPIEREGMGGGAVRSANRELLARPNSSLEQISRTGCLRQPVPSTGLEKRLSSDSAVSSSSGLGVVGDDLEGRGSSLLTVSSRVPPKISARGTSCSGVATLEPGNNDAGVLTDSEGEEDDDDEEEDAEFESSSHESLRDAFWESILKEPAERTDDDIQVIMDTLQQLPAFSNLTSTTCRALCGVIMVAVVREAGQVVLHDEEKLDTWSVILSGTVEVMEPDGTVRELTRGDSFGVRPGKAGADRIHRGVMQTVTDDCQFACVPHADYLRIMSREGDAEEPEMGEGGRVVLVYEMVEGPESQAIGRSVFLPSSTIVGGGCGDAVGSGTLVAAKRGKVVTKGTPEKLIEHLVADLSGPDITYPEDFLLTYRTFIDSPLVIVERLLAWHRQGGRLRSRVNRVVLLWVHNHFNDFEDRREMMQFVDQFDSLLANHGTAGERRLFQLACSTKARLRRVILLVALTGTAPSPGNTSVSLPFTMIGGRDGFGLFVNEVTSDGQDRQQGNSVGLRTTTTVVKGQLRPGDQLLEVNGRPLDNHSVSEAIGLIRVLCSAAMPDAPLANELSPSRASVSTRTVGRLRLLVVYNPVQFHQLINVSERAKHVPTTTNSVPTDSVNQNGPSIRNNTPGDPTALTTLAKSDRPPSGHQRLPVRHEVNRGTSPAGASRGRSQSRGRPVGGDGQHQCLGTGGAGHGSVSAHSSPSRGGQSEDSGCALVPSETGGQGLDSWLALSAGPGKSITAGQLDEPPKMNRSSSQPDLSTPVYTNRIVNQKTPLSTSHLLGPVAVGDEDNGWGHASSSVIIRVWRAGESVREQPSKLVLLPRRQTTALEAIRLAALEFGLPVRGEGSGEAAERLDEVYSLYHVIVEPGPVVKQSRLANFTDDLAGRLTLNSRYYLKVNRFNETLLTNDVIKSILAESRVTFMQIPPEELAIRLTLDDYQVFRSVQATEYIDEVFGLAGPGDASCSPSLDSEAMTTGMEEGVSDGISGSEDTSISDSLGSGGSNSNGGGYATGHGNLDRFTELVNREAYWAPTEVCAEAGLNRRVELLKRFIKLASFCRQLRNFNTMFCILVGLHQTPVERLKQTWERLPNKYQKLYRELSMVLDTSRNFFHYRSLLAADDASAPMIPYLPLVLKDLTFIHLGNPSVTQDGLVNFVKLRMLAKEIRAICRMCNVAYNPETAHRLLQLRQRGRLAGGRVRTAVTWNSKSSTGLAIHPNWSGSRTGDSHDPEDAASGWSLVNESSRMQVNPTASARNQVGLTGRKKSTSGVSAPTIPLVNVKKMYEAWLLTLKIRTYLANLTVESDPETLSQMSIRLEPRDSKASNASLPPTAVASSASSSTEPSSTNSPSKDSPSKSNNPETRVASMPASPKTNTNNNTGGNSVVGSAVSAPHSIPTSASATTCPKTGHDKQPVLPSTCTSPPPPHALLAAPGLEDAHRLAALSDRQKRRSRPPPSRGAPPAFTFPSAQSQLMFGLPGAQAGVVGFGQLPPRTIWSAYPQPTASNNPPGYAFPPRNQFAHYCPSGGGEPGVGLVPAGSNGPLVTGNKSLMLDSLIPTPQRILPAFLRAPGLTALPSRGQSRLMVAGKSRLLRPPHPASGLRQSMQPHPPQQMGRGSLALSPMRAVDPPALPSSGMRQQQACLSRGPHLPGQQRQPQLVSYRYPTASSMVNAVDGAAAFTSHVSRPRLSGQQPQAGGSRQPQPCVSNGSATAAGQWSATRPTRPPPPYDVAVALQQAQRQHHHHQQQTQQLSGADLSRSPAVLPHQLGQTVAVPSRRPLRHPLVRSLTAEKDVGSGHRHRHESTPPQPQLAHHFCQSTASNRPPNGEHLYERAGGRCSDLGPAPPPTSLVTTVCPPRTVSRGRPPPQQEPQQNSRPVPPPYQEAVGITRQTARPASHTSVQPAALSERPAPPQRALAALSLANQISARSASARPVNSHQAAPALLSSDPQHINKS